MTIIAKYRVRCTTDNVWEFVWLPEDTVPTLCPSNGAHTIDTALTSIVERAGDAAPTLSDGRPIVTPSKFERGIDPYICGVGDDLANQLRGQGPAFEVDGALTPQTIEFGFLDTVRIAAGGLMWKGATIGDRIDMWLSAKAPTLTPNPGAGNCNVVSGVVVPAAGDGSHDIDLATCSIVPAPNKDGYWDYADADTGLGTVTAGAPGAAGWHILENETTLVHWVRGAPMLGEGEHYIDPNSVDRKIYPRWTWWTKVSSDSGNALLQCAWYLNLARAVTT